MPTSMDILSLYQSFEPECLSTSGIKRWINPKLTSTLTRDFDFIAKQFIGMKTDNDVANILEIPVGQLLHILYGDKRKYKTFSVKKKSGKERIIESPCASISILQSKVKPLIEAHYRVKKPVHGFVGGGKGIISNAEQHKKKRYVLNVDLEDFFHSVHFGRVRGIFLNTPFNMGNPAATVLAQLCTYKGRLPQGASTSPVLSNLASTTLDRKLVQIAKKFHLTYTRYADDLTFSSNKRIPNLIIENCEGDNGKLMHLAGKLLVQTINDSGFKINHGKTRLQHKSQRQEVTGLVVNNGVNVNREFIRKTRAMINNWRINLLEAEKRFLKLRYKISDHEIKLDKLDGSIYKRAVYGNLSFIKMVKGEEHSPYLNLCKQTLELDSTPPPFIRRLKEVFEMYDVFICHASEDKKEVAIPLYESLNKKGIQVFIDCFAIQWGDSLVAKINTALQKSKFVIAIISEQSIQKSWPMKELNSVLAAEINSQETKLLPLIVGDSASLIAQIPLLQDKLFATFDNNIENISVQFETLLTSKK